MAGVPPLLAVSIAASTPAEALRLAEDARAGGADLVEFRLDFLEPGTELSFLEHRPLPCIAACRRPADGGKFGGTEEERLRLLRAAAVRRPDYLDVEGDAVSAFGALPGGVRLIASHHDAAGIPPDLPDIHRRLLAAGPAIVKIACRTDDAADLGPLIALLERAQGPTAVLGMGEGGAPLRLAPGRFGGALTFAAAEEGMETAPGQPSLRAAREIYRVKSHTPATRLFGLLADPAGHSLSPLLHNAAFRALGLDAVYVPCRVRDLPRFWRDVAPRFEGFSVTIPHKEAVLPLLDGADEPARRISAANTAVRREGRWSGSNTDWLAILKVLAGLEPRGLLGLKDRRAAVLGAGGAARAAVHALKEAGMAVTIFNRTSARATRLAHEAGCASGPPSLLALEYYDLLVNATSVGMAPDEGIPVVPELLSKVAAVFDLVYTPPRTRLLREAARRGLPVRDGAAMFLEQALLQFALFTGIEAPRGLLSETLEGELLKRYGGTERPTSSDH